MRCSAFKKSWRCSASICSAALALSLPGIATGDEARIPLRIGPHLFQAEVAATGPQRERGLMGRTSLPADAGMLFVFEEADRHCFWMKDTPLPLSIAFVDAAGRIASVDDMQPLTDTLHCPAADVRYALEVARGGFQRRGIAAGARVDGLPQ
jgi:uncharacterized membrane protein (UPF0127 family)